MRHLIHSSVLLALLACTACSQASDARRDHLLSGPHGWIDLVVHAPPLAAAASAPGGASQCDLAFRINGEAMLEERGDVARADAASNPLGYRFVAPAGALDTELTIASCAGADIRLPVKLDADHLVHLEFDGHQLVQKSNEPWAPTTLDGMSAQLSTLQEGAHATDGQVARLTWWILGVLVLNLVVLAAVLLRRRQA
jgi:hypothetical protein